MVTQWCIYIVYLDYYQSDFYLFVFRCVWRRMNIRFHFCCFYRNIRYFHVILRWEWVPTWAVERERTVWSAMIHCVALQKKSHDQFDSMSAESWKTQERNIIQYKYKLFQVLMNQHNNFNSRSLPIVRYIRSLFLNMLALHSRNYRNWTMLEQCP